MKTYPLFLILWAVFVVSGGVCWSAPAQESGPAVLQQDLPAIVKSIEPSVVVIVTYDETGTSIGLGSGFFISEDGDVITNRHVLEKASRAEVKATDGKTYPVSNVVAEDKEGDLVRVSVDIPRSAVRVLPVTDAVPEVGERVVVIGAPLGFERTVSDGIASAVRDIPQSGKIIQITAPISRGSSGSPVINMKGEVIGVATFIMVEGQNLNFAVPGERVRKLKPGKGLTLAEWRRSTGQECLGPYSIGLGFLWAEDYEKALPYFEQAIRIKPDFAEAHFGLGVAYGNLGRHSEALEAFKQAMRIKPDDADAHYNLGLAYDHLGRWNEAVEAYKQAIRIKPDRAEPHYNLGVAYDELGRLNEAVEAYKQAIHLKPDDAKAHHNLGVVYGKIGRLNEAVEAFRQAIGLKPDDALAHIGLGAAYANLGRCDDAVEAYKRAIRIKPDDALAHYNLGVAYGELGRLNEAVEAYKQAIRIKPEDVLAHYNLGVSYLAVGDSASALNEYKILKELDTESANQLFNLIYR